MSNLIIDNFSFDHWEGVVKLPTKRVAVFSPADRAFTGAQIFPITGAAFNLKTSAYMNANNRTATSVGLSNKIGRVADIVHNNLDYTLSYGFRFLILNVVHETIDVIAAHHGYRGSTFVTFEPAGRVVSTWTLQAVPAR
jgi:hypothetical protein